MKKKKNIFGISKHGKERIIWDRRYARMCFGFFTHIFLFSFWLKRDEMKIRTRSMKGIER
jgi:hypothetical protein